MDITELTVNIPTEEYEALKEAAKKRNMNVTETLRQAIGMEVIVAEAIARQAKIIIEYPNNITKEIVFE